MPYLEELPSSLPCCLEIPLGKVSCFLGTVPNAPSCFHVSVECLCVLWAQYLPGGLFKAFLGRDYAIMLCPSGSFTREGFTLPDWVHAAFLSCHLKNQCIIVLNLEIWFWRWFSGKLTYMDMPVILLGSLLYECSRIFTIPFMLSHVQGTWLLAV